jgi:hypothetical protein
LDNYGNDKNCDEEKTFDETREKDIHFKEKVVTGCNAAQQCPGSGRWSF